MKKKLPYEMPEIELISFSSEDIITSSSPEDGGENDGEWMD